MIELLQLAILVVLTCVAAPVLADAGLSRLCPAMLGCVRSIGLASVAGSFGGAAAVLRPLLDGHEILVSDFALVPLCGFLAVAAYVDHRTAWAPDELTFPVCMLSGVAAFADGTNMNFGILAALSLGFALFTAAKAAWIVQGYLARTILPPPDVVGVSLPLVLFDSWATAAICLVALALVLTAIGCMARLTRLAGCSECLEIAFDEAGWSRRARGIALLGIAYPLTALFLVAEALVCPDTAFVPSI